MAKSFKVDYKISRKGNAYVPYKGYVAPTKEQQESIDNSVNIVYFILFIIVALTTIAGINTGY